ncbi:MAG TPA: DUF1259 domain-containing protein [Gemmatimonadaceae bacterium]
MSTALVCLGFPGAQQTLAQGQWSAVTAAIGHAGALQPDSVMKFSFPRSDLNVTLDGARLRPSFALGTWIAFKRLNDRDAMVMGDLVLTEKEVPAVMSRLLESGSVMETALHNHLIGESPRVMYMHIHADGDARRIATALRAALAESGTPITAASNPAGPVSVDLDTARIARILGFAGKANDGVYQVSVPRTERIQMGAVEIPRSMGVSTAINFQPTGSGTAAITGDFVLTAGEVPKVISALRRNGITVTALHNHMLVETPRLFFMHFWAKDDAVKLATGLRAALNAMDREQR